MARPATLGPMAYVIKLMFWRDGLESLDELRWNMDEEADKLATKYGFVSPSVDITQYDPHDPANRKGRPKSNPRNLTKRTRG